MVLDEKIYKILAMAIDQAGKPEGDVAAAKFIQIIKAQNIDLENILRTCTTSGPKTSTASAGGSAYDKYWGPGAEEWLNRYKKDFDARDRMRQQQQDYSDPSKIRMTFGKHKGKFLTEIPSDYLEWVLENCTKLNPRLKDAIKKAAEMDEKADAEEDRWWEDYADHGMGG
jgi:hypothetical protein